MKTLYLDCGMGAAGDMLTAALLELFPNPAELIDELNALGLRGVTYEAEACEKCGVRGTHVSVKVHGEEEGAHEREHEHDHHHAHHHSDMHEIAHIIEALPVSERVRADITEVYARIADAESQVHGVPVSEIHFHEVGAMDAVADVAAVCLLMERLAPDRVIVSPVHVGSGQVKCAHGILPVPAPATARILQNVPIYGGAIQGELCTPTGAALLTHFAADFGAMPVMKTRRIGYGMGKKDFPAANCVRAFLGETEDAPAEQIYELSCNLDDMTAEAIAYAQERIFASGALEVYTVPAQMKKSRPGVVLSALCREADRESVVRAIFRHTTTIGVRECAYRRYTLSRTVETVSTPRGGVHKKISRGYGVTREKMEFEDIARIAREMDIPLAEAADYVAECDS